MKIKLFGKNIFEFSSQGERLFEHSNNIIKKSKFLPDFYSMSDNHPLGSSDYTMYVSEGTITSGTKSVPQKIKKVKKVKKEKEHLTLRGVYDMKMLNEKSFKINTNAKYVEDQLQSFKDKLNIIGASETDMERGVQEISSIILRMENRKKYSKFKKFFENYPYASTIKIIELLENHKYLKLGKVEQFLADMPKEAVKEMKDYNKNTKDLCGKKPLFYIVADKKDFEKSKKRKDPILLAQSPFGHFWQILGVWDKEMLLLEEL